MRPDPNELIRGVRQLLREVVAPELSSGVAALSLRRIMQILRDTDWNETAFQVEAENGRLASLVGLARRWADGDPDRPSLIAAVDAAVPLPVETTTPASTFVEAAAFNCAQRAWLAAFVDLISDDPLGSTPECRTLRSDMAAAFLPSRHSG